MACAEASSPGCQPDCLDDGLSEVEQPQVARSATRMRCQSSLLLKGVASAVLHAALW